MHDKKGAFTDISAAVLFIARRRDRLLGTPRDPRPNSAKSSRLADLVMSSGTLLTMTVSSFRDGM
jgi:hypothetical protein